MTDIDEFMKRFRQAADKSMEQNEIDAKPVCWDLDIWLKTNLRAELAKHEWKLIDENVIKDETLLVWGSNSFIRKGVQLAHFHTLFNGYDNIMTWDGRCGDPTSPGRTDFPTHYKLQLPPKEKT